MREMPRFSPRPNRADEIRWRPWGAAAFEEAAEADKPVLLNLTAVWCRYCHEMDETTYSAPSLIELINEETIPIRVDADRYPHVEQRYIAGGWPTNAFLTPTGEVLWAGTYASPNELRSAARSVLDAWHDRRDEVEAEVERRRKAMHAARSRRPTVGLVRREAADDVLTAIRQAFDTRNGGFGGEPKFPRPAAVELLFTRGLRDGNPEWTEMAERTLDGMLAGQLRDSADGGFFRYALRADWTEPRYEKLLEVNAELVRVYALGARLRGRDDWRAAAESAVDWVERTLARGDGLWGGSQLADPAYHEADADARADRDPPPVDGTVYTDRNAVWVRALAEAGARLGRDDWIERAAAALDTLLDAMAAPDDLLHHHRPPGDAPAVRGLLTDSLEAASACVAVMQATGDGRFLGEARRLADAMGRALWTDDGGFQDHLQDGPDGRVAALRYRDRPFGLNANAARLLIDLELATGERGYRARAERILAVLSPLAGRHGVEGAAFAAAAEEFFDPPLRVVVVGSAADAASLRRAALRLRRADRRVWSFECGGRIGPLRFPDDEAPTAYVCGAHTCSDPVRDADRIETVAAGFD